MTTNRLWIIGALIIIVAMIAGTYLIGVAPQLAVISAANVDLQTAQQQNAGYREAINVLKKDFQDITTLRSGLKDLREEIPAELDQTTLLGQIGEIGTAHEVSVESITFDTPINYVPGDSTDEQVLAAMGSVSAGNLYVIPMALTVNGTMEHVLAFLNDLQNGKRLFLAYEVNFAAAGDDPTTGTLTLGIAGQVFVLSGATQVPPVGDETTIEDPVTVN